MNKEKEAVVQCYLYEMKQLPEKYELWLDSGEDNLFVSDGGVRIISTKVLLNDKEYNVIS